MPGDYWHHNRAESQNKKKRENIMNKELYDEAVRSNVLSKNLISELMESMNWKYFFYQLDCRSTDDHQNTSGTLR